jgi:hypothetical protein
MSDDRVFFAAQRARTTFATIVPTKVEKVRFSNFAADAQGENALVCADHTKDPTLLTTCDNARGKSRFGCGTRGDSQFGCESEKSAHFLVLALYREDATTLTGDIGNRWCFRDRPHADANDGLCFFLVHLLLLSREEIAQTSLFVRVEILLI